MRLARAQEPALAVRAVGLDASLGARVRALGLAHALEVLDPLDDERYAQLTSAGYLGRQPPFDAFWGARYAIVADPDGNDVGLMSPMEESRRTWPPARSPDP